MHITPKQNNNFYNVYRFILFNYECMSHISFKKGKITNMKKYKKMFKKISKYTQKIPDDVNKGW